MALHGTLVRSLGPIYRNISPAALAGTFFCFHTLSHDRGRGRGRGDRGAMDHTTSNHIERGEPLECCLRISRNNIREVCTRGGQKMEFISSFQFPKPNQSRSCVWGLPGLLCGTSCFVPRYCFKNPDPLGARHMASLRCVGTNQLYKISDLHTIRGLKSDAFA